MICNVILTVPFGRVTSACGSGNYIPATGLCATGTYATDGACATGSYNPDLGTGYCPPKQRRRTRCLPNVIYIVNGDGCGY